MQRRCLIPVQLTIGRVMAFVRAWLGRHGPKKHPVLYATGAGALVVLSGGGAVYIFGAAKTYAAGKAAVLGTAKLINSAVHPGVLPVVLIKTKEVPKLVAEVPPKVVAGAAAEVGKKLVNATSELISPTGPKIKRYRVFPSKSKLALKGFPVKIAQRPKKYAYTKRMTPKFV